MHGSLATVMLLSSLFRYGVGKRQLPEHLVP
jgi:hypothetical protein